MRETAVMLQENIKKLKEEIIQTNIKMKALNSQDNDLIESYAKALRREA
jgi:cell division protein FtsB